jgi:hypothetical protein
MRRSSCQLYTETGIISPTQAYGVGKVIRKYLVENPDGVELPGKLGILKIVGLPRKAISPKLSKIYGKTIIETNPHTDGLKFMVIYEPFKKGFMRKRGFRFVKGLRFRPGDPLGDMIAAKLRKDPYHFRRVL